MSWATEELLGLDLQDKRLNKRCIMLLETLAEKPTISIPSACSGWSETLAAYRFMANEKVTADQIINPHISSTMKRIEAQKVVLTIQEKYHSTIAQETIAKADIQRYEPIFSTLSQKKQ